MGILVTYPWPERWRSLELGARKSRNAGSVLICYIQFNTYMYTVFHKKRSSIFVIIALKNLDEFH